MEHIANFFIAIVDTAGYPGLFFVMLLGNLGIPVGTELVVPIAGALSATGHLSSVWLVGLIATVGEVLGGYILFAIGYYGGHPFLERYGKYMYLRHHELDRVHNFYERYGAKMVFVSRFIPVIRGIAALPAGLSQMRARTFGVYTTAGSAIFCFGLADLGHAFGKHIDAILPLLHKFTVLVILIVGAAVAFGVFQLLRQRARGKQPA